MFGCCCKVCSDDPPDHFFNNPTVTVAKFGGGTEDIPAAMQPWEECGYGLTGGCGHPINWKDFCGGEAGNPDGRDPIPCGTIAGPSVMGSNNFTLNPDWKPIARCQHPGWKAVVAMPCWPGMFGFNSDCCPMPASPQVKYRHINRTLSASISCDATFSETATPDSMSFSGSASMEENYFGDVDLYGNIKASAWGSSKHVARQEDANVSGPPNVTEVDVIDFCGTDAWLSGTYKPANMITPASYGTASGLIGIDWINFGPLFSGWAFSAACGRIRIQWTGGSFEGTPDEVNAAQIIGQVPDANYGTLVEEMGGGRVRTWSRKNIELKPLVVELFSDTKVVLAASGSFESSYEEKIDGVVVQQAKTTLTFDFRFSAELSVPITHDEVQADGEVLQDTWNLGDHEQYPWRQDGMVWLVPLVTRDAYPNGPDGGRPECPDPLDITFTNPDPNTWVQYGRRAAQPRDLRIGNYSGRIIGAPQPVGHGRYFNFTQKVVETCCPPGLLIHDLNWFCLSGWGELSPSALPKTATQWTDAQLGSLLMEGAYVMQYSGGYLLMQKWAESKMPFPSVNLARPFGRDRFLIDFATPGLTDDPACGSTAGIAIGSFSGDIVTDPGSFLYAHRKFPTCRAIGSTLAITAAVQTSPGVITLTTAEKHWLCGTGDGHGYTDQIDCYGIPGLGAAVTVQTATPNTNTLTVNGTLTAAYTGAGYIASAGVTQELGKWDWTCPRHRFIEQRWLQVLRANGGYTYTEAEQTLAPLSGMSVLLCSPNADSFPANQAVYRAAWQRIPSESCSEFSESSMIGNRWHCKFIQAVSDPFYIAPVKCSGDAAEELFRNAAFGFGGGGTDSWSYYALVEPMLAMPPGAPAPAVAIARTFESGPPSNCTVNCQMPESHHPTDAVYYDLYMATVDGGNGWRTVTHHKCMDAVNKLPDAAGYVDPADSGGSAGGSSASGGGKTPPETTSTSGGAGAGSPGSGGAGDSEPGAGDQGSGGLI